MDDRIREIMEKSHTKSRKELDSRIHAIFFLGFLTGLLFNYTSAFGLCLGIVMGVIINNIVINLPIGKNIVDFSNVIITYFSSLYG